MIKVSIHSRVSGQLARILTILLLFVAIPLHTFADKNSYQGVKLSKPKKENNFYLINNRSELLWWAVNDQNVDIKIMADINVQGDKQLLKADGKTLAISEKDIVVWPCVYYRASAMTIEGNNHTISGIYQKGGYGVNKGLGSFEKYDYVGFISWSMTKTIITNLNIADSYLEGKYAGGFIGQKSKSGSMALSEYKNCSFRGYVKGEKYAGGHTGWYRTDGQDASFYRCFNYGIIESGDALSKNTDTGAGGLIGYLDITHTPAAKANTYFNRCVNYGNITCLTPGGSVGGIIGKVWDYNNGKREWRFCFNFGDVTKYDLSKKSLAGSGLLGNYANTNGKSQPKFLGCGNAKKSDTGSLLDSLSWNYKDHEPFIVKGSKTNMSSQIYSSITKDDSWSSWWSNHWGTVTVIAVVLLVTAILTGGLSLAAGSAAAADVTAAEAAYAAAMAAYDMAPAYIVPAAKAALAAVASISTALLAGGAGGAIGGGILAGVGEAYNYLRNNANASNIMVEANLPYTDRDLRTANFAYDANLMMQADSIDGKLNTDKSILFKQHIDVNDSTKSDTIPTIITNFNSTADKLYFGYDRCHRIPTINNDPNLAAMPSGHSFDNNGECTYCHLKQQPLGRVLKDGGHALDYYTIENEAQLNYLANAFNGENEEAYKLYNGATIKLIADIKYSNDQAWMPIGSSILNPDGNTVQNTKWHPFRGNFDGQGHTIEGLKTCELVNYAGLFGYVETDNEPNSIKNVNLSNCQFRGNVAGTIAGYLLYNGFSQSYMDIDRVTADSSVIVAETGKNENSHAGGFFGKLDHYTNHEFVISYCYSNAHVLNENTNAGSKDGNTCGYFMGEYNRISDGKTIFKHCYFGGESPSSKNVIGNNEMVGANRMDFEDCYCVGEQPEAKQQGVENAPKFVSRNYMTSSHLAYDLMKKSKVIETGDTAYFYTQKGNYPVLTNTKQPTLCKVNIEVEGMARGCNIQMADTIINTNDKKLAVPFMFGNRNVQNANLMGWNDEYRNGDPVYLNEYNDFSELYKTPTRYYTLLLDPKNIPAIANIQSETEWKGAGVLAGYQQTNIMEDLYLQGSNAWSLQLAPQCIDGNNKTVSAGMPLISNVEDATSAARRYSRARGVGARASQESADITIQNLRVQTDTLTQDLLSKGARKLNLNNLILEPVDADETIFDWNSETKTANTKGLNLKNVVCRKNDSTSVAFYKDGTDVMATTFSDKNKNNDYEHILNYMLSQEGMLDVFGLRLSGKNEKVAGKLGFASEESKRIYRVKTYNQSTGLAEGEILMNYDGDVTFDVKGSRVGTMHEGLPDGTFAVLPLTREELGDKFKNLGKNIITKDGEAACIRLEEGKTDGFAYPSYFDADKEMVLSADRIEYVRKVHRDGLHETINLPCAFNSVEFDENDYNDEDQVEISFMNRHADEEGIPDTPSGLSDDGKSISLMSLRSYYAKKYADGYDPSQDIDSTDIFRQAFYAGIPYMIVFKCAERTDELSTVTFVGTNGEYGIGFLREEDPVDPEALFAPLYGTFHTKVAGEIAKGMKIFGLDVFTNEETGNLYDKFVRLKDTDRIEAFRCFIATNSSLVGDDIGILVDDDTTTGINGIKYSDQKKNGRIFDLSGRRVMKKTPRNIYIQNGKKVVNF